VVAAGLRLVFMKNPLSSSSSDAVADCFSLTNARRFSTPQVASLICSG
jgi:hypothetical protein